MTNKIFKLENGREYLVLKTKIIDSKLYGLLIEVDSQSDNIDDNNIILKEIKFKNDNAYFYNIEGNEVNIAMNLIGN